MKPYQKIMGISIIVLASAAIVFVLLAARAESFVLLIPALVAYLFVFILTIVLMLLYKNNLLRRLFLYGMPVFLMLHFLTYYIHVAGLKIIFLFLLVYTVIVNMILHFRRYDINMVVIVFIMILGLLFKSFHMAGTGIWLIVSSFLAAFFLIVIAIGAIRTKDNRYLSIVVFSCCLILAMQCFTFTWKMMHWPGAGILVMVSVPVFIIATLIVLLTLPGSNFIEWTRQQKKILLRGLLIPWLFFIYIIAVVLFLQGRATGFFFFLHLQNPDKEVSFYMDDYDLDNRNGLIEDTDPNKE